MATLTNRQEDVLVHVIEGKSNKQIAKTLFVSDETIKEHVGDLLKATNLANRTQLAVWGVKRKKKMSLIIKAAKFAAEKHEGQYRKYRKDKYITHPARVASRVSYHSIANNDTIAAAWLHDVLEDCAVSEYQLRNEFGDKVVDYCIELTNPSKGSKELRAVRKQMDRDHLRTVSKEAKVIKMIDRIDNVTELNLDREHVDSKYLKKYADESVLLLEVLKDADKELADELTTRIRILNGN